MMQLTINLPDNAYEALQSEAKQSGESVDRLIVKHLSILKLISGNNEDQAIQNSWPDGFFEATAGCFSDDQLERAPQGKVDKRLDF